MKKRGTHPSLHSAKIYLHIIIFSVMLPCFVVRLVPTVRMKLLSLYSSVKMEWVRFDERLDHILQSKVCHNPENHNINVHCREKSDIA
jgi:hypothetical protein